MIIALIRGDTMSQFTIVIRLESNDIKMYSPIHFTGVHPFINAGCYSGTRIAHRALDALDLGANSGDDNHPCPHWDGIKCIPGEFIGICAFKDAQQFHAWFPYPQGLASVANIARLALYKICNDHINYGGKQITICPEHMVLVDVLPTDISIDAIDNARALLLNRMD
jgi:hypothetical protein